MRRIGFWSDDEEPLRLVDFGWDPAERALVVEYLKNGQVDERCFGSSYCRFGCHGGKMWSEMGSRDFTDGRWLWPEGYAHYLEVHGLKPPNSFIEWVKLERGR